MIGRRRFLAASAGLPFAVSGFGQESGPPGLRIWFDAAPPAELPPPLEPGPEPRVAVVFSGAGPYAQCSLGMRVMLAGKPHLLPLAIWTPDPQAYWRMREALHLPAFRGEIKRAGHDWSLWISGQEAFSARAVPAAAGTGAEGESLPWVAYRQQLSPRWADGPLGSRPVELWRLPVTGAGVRGMTQLPEASGGLDGWLAKLGASAPVSGETVPARSLGPGEFAQHVPASDFEPFALRNYAPGSLGLPPIDTQFCGPAALEAYRGQSRTRLAGVLIMSVDCVATPQLVERLVPPPCVADPNALVRVMTIRGLRDPAQDEAWLLARCDIDGERAWYALSHIKNSLAGSAYGREAWGYPTKPGRANAMLGASRFTASVMRGSGSLYRADGTYGGFSTGTSLNEMLVATLRPKLGSDPQPTAGELLLQQWYYQGLRKPSRRESLHASFPAPANNGAADAWSGMGPVDAYWADIYDDADLQRMPARLAGEVSDIGTYYRDRCDGQLPWEAPAAERGQTSD